MDTEVFVYVDLSGTPILVGRLAVSKWREEAQKLGLSQAAISRMTSAFEHEDLSLVMGGRK